MGWRDKAIVVDSDRGISQTSSWKDRAKKVDYPEDKDTSFLEKADTALENFGNVATLGYLPQLQAGLVKAQDFITPDSFGMDSGKSYVDLRDANIERQAKMSQQNPKSALAGIGTGIASSFLLPTGALGEVKALKSAKDAGFLAKAGMGALKGGISGVAYGALSNPGDVKGEISPAQPMQRLGKAGEGLLYGAGSGGLVEGALNLPKLGKGLVQKGSDIAFKALGPFKADIKKLGEDIPGKVSSIGKTALDEGVIGWVPKSALNLSKKAKEQLQKKGQEFEYYLNKIDYALKEKYANMTGKEVALAGGAGKLPKVGVDKVTIADRIRKDFIDESGHPQAEEINAKVNSFLDKLTSGPDNILEIKNAQKLKVAADKLANWKKNPTLNPLTLDEQINRALSNHIKDGIIDSADAAINHLGTSLDPDTISKFKKVKKDYGNLASAKSISGNRSRSDVANRVISPSDYGTGLAIGAGSLATGGSPLIAAAMGAGLGAINHGLRKYGNQFLAKTLNEVGNKLENNPILKSRVVNAIAEFDEKRPEVTINLIRQLTGIAKPDYSKKSIENEQ